MAFGVELIFAMAIFLALPFIAFVVGYRRNRRHSIKKVRFARTGGTLIASYYAVVAILYLFIFATYYLSGQELDNVAPFACLVVLIGPGIALAVILIAESTNKQAIEGFCPDCGYNIEKSRGHGCPECGWNRKEEGTEEEGTKGPRG